MQTIGEYNTSGTLLRRHVPGVGMDETVASYEGSGTTNRQWLLADERGSIIALANASGTATTINTYDEYGVPGPGNAGRFQYTGQVWLTEAQLYHYKARAYDPRLGRFMQTDPIGYGDGLNLYAYVGADPVNVIDPSGLQGAGGGGAGTWARVATGWQFCTKLEIPERPDLGVGITCVDEYEWQYFDFSIFTTQAVGPGGGGGAQSLERIGPKPPSHDDNDPDYNRDLNQCRALDDPGARARCYESAERRRRARDNGVPEIALPPLILWRVQPLPIPSPRCLRLRHPFAILGCAVITN